MKTALLHDEPLSSNGTSFAPTAGVVPSPAHQAPASVAIPQYGIRRILAVWAAAALPMGALAWLVAPALKDSFAGTGSVQMAKALIVCFDRRPDLAVRPGRRVAPA